MIIIAVQSLYGNNGDVNGEIPVTRAATELMHDSRRKIPLRFPLLCGFFHFIVHPSILVGLGSQLLGG